MTYHNIIPVKRQTKINRVRGAKLGLFQDSIPGLIVGFTIGVLVSVFIVMGGM